jgi:chromate transporter
MQSGRPSPSSPSHPAPPGRTSLGELALLFARLGATAFGGPAAHIAMMRDEVVSRRQWLSEERFLDLLGATNLIPGPNSTELALHIGWERRRLPGLLVAGVAFIVPAMLVTGALGWAYLRLGALPSAGWLLYGVKPVILSVVAQAIWGLLPRAARNRSLSVIGALALVLSACGVHELLVLLGAGLCAIAIARARSRRAPRPGVLALLPGMPLVASAKLSVVSLPSLFWVFFKTGSVLFGSGYVLLAFLRADLVERLHWLSPAQLIDAIAVGQVTPGPVFTTATFIGYVIAGPRGALAATIGIFLPAFFFVAISGPLVPRLRGSATAAAFLDGVNVASLALMAVVTAQLGRAAIVDLPALALALASALLLLRFKLNSAWLVLGGAAAGFAIHALGLGAG